VKRDGFEREITSILEIKKDHRERERKRIEYEREGEERRGKKGGTHKVLIGWDLKTRLLFSKKF